METARDAGLDWKGRENAKHSEMPNTLMVRMRVRLVEALDELARAREELDEIKRSTRHTHMQEVEVLQPSLLDNKVYRLKLERMRKRP